jgi:hypothetical protein
MLVRALEEVKHYELRGDVHVQVVAGGAGGAGGRRDLGQLSLSCDARPYPPRQKSPGGIPYDNGLFGKVAISEIEVEES